MDISDTIIAKSDQLNAEDLIAGPITVTITGVKRTSDEQPVSVEISGGHKPWKPCKTMRRLLIMAWPDGAKKENGETKYDPACWVGRVVTLIRDPNVKWAGELVGGIRVTALSHIKAKFEVALAESKKKKKLVAVEKLDTPAGTKSEPPKQTPVSTDTSPLTESFAAMKGLWKKRREVNELSVNPQEWTDFIQSATEGLIAVANVLKPTAFTPEVIQRCLDRINAEMPEPESVEL